MKKEEVKRGVGIVTQDKTIGVFLLSCFFLLHVYLF